MSSPKNSESNSRLVIRSSYFRPCRTRYKEDIQGLSCHYHHRRRRYQKAFHEPSSLGTHGRGSQENVFRIHTAKRYRVIYSIFDQLGAIIVITVRLKGKDTYKDIPVHNIATQVEAIEEKLKSASCEVTYKPTPRQFSAKTSLLRGCRDHIFGISWLMSPDCR